MEYYVIIGFIAFAFALAAVINGLIGTNNPKKKSNASEHWEAMFSESDNPMEPRSKIN